MSSEETKVKPRPPAPLFALGREDLPQEVQGAGAVYRFTKLFKHDFFAATGLYEKVSDDAPASDKGAELTTKARRHEENAEKKNLESSSCLRAFVVQNPAYPQPTQDENAAPRWAVLKIQRTYPLYGFPMQWLGKKVAGHEIRIYEKLQGVPGIPAFLGRVGPTGFLHEFIPGVDLHSDLPFTAEFFAELEALFRALHDRHVAYVDSNKRENILYGDDGHPWLIDFQISFQCKKEARDNLLAKMILRKFIKADWYHFYKHKTRLLPSICSAEDFAKAQRRGFLHQLHRRVARPLIVIRRKFLSRYDLAKTR